MDKIQSQVKEFMLRAGQACPDRPTIPDLATRQLRARLTLEEALEKIDCLGINLVITPIDRYNGGCLQITDVSFEDGGEVDLVGVIDGIADVSFVNYGLANAIGVDMEPIEQAVYENNMSKFIDGWTDEHGKFRKGPSYKPVDLKPLLEEQYAK